LDILLTLQYEKPFDRLHRIHQLDSSEIRSSGYVVDTLEAALWAISHVEKKEKNEERIGLISKDYANSVLSPLELQ
jgi:possible ADP-ribosyl-[dinitrogen reductase] hydrolase